MAMTAAQKDLVTGEQGVVTTVAALVIEHAASPSGQPPLTLAGLNARLLACHRAGADGLAIVNNGTLADLLAAIKAGVDAVQSA